MECPARDKGAPHRFQCRKVPLQPLDRSFLCPCLRLFSSLLHLLDSRSPPSSLQVPSQSHSHPPVRQLYNYIVSKVYPLAPQRFTRCCFRSKFQNFQPPAPDCRPEYIASHFEPSRVGTTYHRVQKSLFGTLVCCVLTGYEFACPAPCRSHSSIGALCAGLQLSCMSAGCCMPSASQSNFVPHLSDSLNTTYFRALSCYRK